MSDNDEEQLGDDTEAGGGKEYVVKLNGHRRLIQDFPVGVIETISNDNQVFWGTVVVQPMLKLGVARDLVLAYAKELGIDAPTLTPRNIVEFFELVDEEPLPTPPGGDDDDPLER